MGSKMNQLRSDTYGDHEVVEYNNTRTPRWLWIFYIGTPLFAALWIWIFWNGTTEPLDPGHWHQLQQAADTTFPLQASKGPDPAEQTPYVEPLPGV